MANQTGCGAVKLGSKNDCVKMLQQLLNNIGYGLLDDGVFGGKTQNAVMDYQRQRSLTTDGIVGDKTWDKLVDDFGNNIKIKPDAGRTSNMPPPISPVIQSTTLPTAIPKPTDFDWKTIGIGAAIVIALVWMLFGDDTKKKRHDE